MNHFEKSTLCIMSLGVLVSALILYSSLSTRSYIQAFIQDIEVSDYETAKDIEFFAKQKDDGAWEINRS